MEERSASDNEGQEKVEGEKASQSRIINGEPPPEPKN